MTTDFAAAAGIRGRAILHAEIEKAEEEYRSAGSRVEPEQVVSWQGEIAEVGE
jgi:hypothetical protein